ncbi:ER lumen protein retaining receptor, partial [Wilcoxina mikolae CBS 423.85]
MAHFNVFRILGDLSHLLSKAILIFTVHHHKSAEGVSLLTQALYALVFLTRYLDLFSKYALDVLYNFLFKITYIATSFYILFLMFRIYPRSRESENQWKLTVYILCFSAITAPILYLIFKGRNNPWDTRDLFRHFSWILESLAVLPQLTLLAHTSVPTVINSYYLLALGSYRALYIPNWLVRYAHHEHPETVSVIFGVLQTALYVEFLWIYVNRQKVKLRGGGGVLDGEEFARGIVLGRLIGGDEGRKGTR